MCILSGSKDLNELIKCSVNNSLPHQPQPTCLYLYLFCFVSFILMGCFGGFFSHLKKALTP